MSGQVKKKFNTKTKQEFKRCKQACGNKTKRSMFLWATQWDREAREDTKFRVTEGMQ